jgi:hypothetical protein
MNKYLSNFLSISFIFLSVFYVVPEIYALGMRPFRAQVTYEFTGASKASINTNGCLNRNEPLTWKVTYVSLPSRRAKAGLWVDPGLSFNTRDTRKNEESYWGSPTPRRQRANSQGVINYSVDVASAFSATERNLTRTKRNQPIHRNTVLVGNKILIQGLAEKTIDESTDYKPRFDRNNFGLRARFCE